MIDFAGERPNCDFSGDRSGDRSGVFSGDFSGDWKRGWRVGEVPAMDRRSFRGSGLGNEGVAGDKLARTVALGRGVVCGEGTGDD